MKLTGKCKKDFEKWFFNNYGIEEASFVREEGGFFNLPQSMQWGVIQDFGDSVKMPFFVKHVENYIYEVTYDFWVYGYGWGGNFKTRSQAQEEAIKQFNKIYNSTKQTESI